MTLYNDTHLLMLEKGEITCEDIELSLCDYADGDLPKTVKARIDAHTDSCQFCKKNVESYLLTVQLASTLRPQTPITSDIQTRLRRALNERLHLNLPEVPELQ